MMYATAMTFENLCQGLSHVSHKSSVAPKGSCSVYAHFLQPCAGNIVSVCVCVCVCVCVIVFVYVMYVQ